MFENKIINGVHASRYIASWFRAGGNFGRWTKGRFDFRNWLESLGLAADDVNYIYNLADNGRLELQEHATQFMRALDE